MKKSAKLKRKTTRMVVKNLIVFAVLIAVAAVSVRSWFSDGHNSSDAKTISVSCDVPEGLEVAIVAPGDAITSSTEWHETSFTIDSASYPFLSSLSIADVTGDGVSFIQPPMMQTSSVAHPNVDGDWSTEKIKTTANKEYLSLDVYFRTKKTGQKVVLSKDTYYGPPVSTQDFGNAVSGWHANSVIGAARMSVLNTSNARQLLWIPAPFLYFDGTALNTAVTSTSNTYGLYYLDSTGNQVDIHEDGTFNHGYYSANKTRSKINYNASNPKSGVTASTSKDYKLGKDVDIASLTTSAIYSGNTYNTNRVRINMWIEGEDPESRSAQVGGQFKAVLSLKMTAQ